MHTTTRLGWLTRSLADVPVGDRWLGARERAVLEGLLGDKRRREWCVGRHAAKAAVAAWLSVPPERVEVLPAADGAPHAYLDAEAAPVTLSLSHRADRALAVVAAAGCDVGCDLEAIEPRSRAFISGWLTPQERAVLEPAAGPDGHRLANVMWAAREAAVKVHTRGLQLGTRRAVATLDDVNGAHASWRRLTVSLRDHAMITGWWRAEPGWVMAIAAEHPVERPHALG